MNIFTRFFTLISSITLLYIPENLYHILCIIFVYKFYHMNDNAKDKSVAFFKSANFCLLMPDIMLYTVLLTKNILHVYIFCTHPCQFTIIIHDAVSLPLVTEVQSWLSSEQRALAPLFYAYDSPL